LCGLGRFRRQTALLLATTRQLQRGKKKEKRRGVLQGVSRGGKKEEHREEYRGNSWHKRDSTIDGDNCHHDANETNKRFSMKRGLSSFSLFKLACFWTFKTIRLPGRD
jgi:hypothetical protein